MRTNVLNDLSNVVKKGTGLACSWSQVGRMSEGAPDEHPMSIRSASDGERWKPAGEKGSTRVWKHVAMIFAVLVMSMANIGMAWGADKTYTVQNPAASKRYVQDNIMMTGTTATSKKIANSSQNVFYLQNGNYAPTCVISKAANIKKVVIYGNRDTGSSSQGTAFNLQASTNAIDFSVPTSGFTATKQDNGDPAALGSLSAINMIGNNQSYATTVTVTFTSPVMAIRLVGTASVSIKSIAVTYDDAITVDPELCEVHMTSTTAAALTGTGTWTATNIQSGNNYTDASSNTYYYDKSSGTYGKIDLGSGNTFQEGDEIWFDMNGNGLRAPGACGYKLNSSNSTSGAVTIQPTCTIAANMPMYMHYITKSTDPWVGQQVLWILRYDSNDRLYQLTIHRSGGGGCTSITPTWSTDYSSTTLNVGATSSTPVVGKDGSSGAVTFSSSDTYIATVNSSGVVTGVGAGTATITATVAADGGKCEGTVTKSFTIKAGITYNANGADGGSVPTDASTYAYNANITVAGNTGSLYKTGFVFNGWNTRSDGTGTHYEAGATMKMPSKSAGVTLYAEWVGYATSWEWWNCGQSNNSTTFTYITSKNYICSFASSASTAVASWDMSGGEYYRGIKIKTKDHSIAFWVQTGKRVSITFGTRPTKPTFTVGGVDKSSEVGASTNSDSITVTYTTTADTKFYIENETATNTAFTVKSVKIEDAAPSCTAPNHVDISGDWDYFGGETISLSAQAYSSAGTGSPIADGDITGYQWKHNGVDIVGATSKTFTKTTCTSADGGDYSCVVSTGATCSTESSPMGIKVYVLQCYTGGETTYNFTRTGSSQAGTTEVTLSSGTQYEFKIYAGSTASTDYHMGNNGTIDEDASNWDFEGGKNNVKLNSGLGGTFTFAIDYSANGGAPKVSVTYPRKTIYLTPGVWNTAGAKFAFYYFRDEGSSGWTDLLTNNDCGMSAEIPQWNGVKINAVRLSDDATVGTWDKKWNQTSDITVNSNNSVVITDWGSGDSPYTYGTYSIPTYTISYNAGTGGSGSKASESKTCGVAFTLPNSAVFTRTGYTQTGWTTSDGGAQEYALGGTYTTNAAQTFYPVWSCITPDAPAAAKITATDGCSGSSGATFSADDSGKPSYVTWYWQTASDGTSTSYPVSSDYETASTAGSKTMYVRAKNTACDTWSTAASKSATVKTAATIAWNTAPADGTAGGSMTASVTTNYSDGVAYAVTSASPAGCVTVGASTGVISYVAAGTATIRATVTGAGNYCSSAYVDQAINVTAAAVLTALECNTLYKVEDMVPASITLSGTGQYGAGLSANTKFEVIGDPAQTDGVAGTPEMKNEAASFAEQSFTARMYLKGASNTTGSGTTFVPTSRAVKFIVSESGTLDIYAHRVDRLYLKKVGDSGTTQLGTSTSGSGSMVSHNVTAGTYYIYATGNSTCVYGVRLNCCTTPAAPTVFSAGSITSTGATFSITDAGDAASYDIYYATSSTAPTASTPATTTSTSKTKAVTGLTASTTYYAWVRSVCDADHKSAWVALSGSSFTTSAAETPIITWEMKLTSGQNWGLNGDPSTTDNTNITSISANNTHAAQLEGKTANGTMTAGCTTAQNGTARDNNIYVEFKFHVGCDKKLTPSKISLQVSNIGGSSDGNMTYDAILTDGTRTVSGSVTPASDGTLTTLEFTNADASKYMQGDVTLRVYPYNNNGGNTGSGFRMGQYVKIFGEIANQATPAATITWTTQPANGQVGDPDFAYDVTCSDGSAVTVTSANTTYATIVGGKLHYASAGTTHLVASATDACGNVLTPVNSNDFTVSAAAPTHDVTFSLTNVVYSSGDNQGTGAATEGSAFSTVFAASSGYSLPGTITVTIGGVEQTEGTGYTWTQGTGTLTIPAAYVTDDIVVTIVGEEMEGDGCDELVHTEAATATTLTTTVGSATLTNPSGQTANDKAIKLNSSGYIELSPKAGKSFAAGDSLIIVMWNQASSAKTTGYRIAGTDYTASMPSKVNTTFRRKLIAADIVSSKVKIERESDNGSNAYFVSAIIKHCEDLPSCTTPTLPSLSDQTVCPGSDIAAWNAEPTNIATITGASEDVAYSWKKKGSDTELAATASFDLGSSATESQAGTYVVTVTVSKTGYISKSASAEVDLTVIPETEEPSVSQSPAKAQVSKSVTLTATCGSAGTKTWSWHTCNSDGSGESSAISGATTNTYALTAPASAGTYYYKVKVTGDGTNACGTASHVYALTVAAASECTDYFWFPYATDATTNGVTNNEDSFFGASPTTGSSNSGTYAFTLDGTTYTATKNTGSGAITIPFTIPEGATASVAVNCKASSSSPLFIAHIGVDTVQVTNSSSYGAHTIADLAAGSYKLFGKKDGSGSWTLCGLGVHVCSSSSCTDATPVATATNTVVCSGTELSITASEYEESPTSIQWQKLNSSTSTWDNISGATSATYTVAYAAAEHAGSYRVVVTKGCARTSNTVTIAVPSAPDFGSTVPASVSIMQTLALSISDVEATDAVKYRWYKSADTTWDAGDEEIGTEKTLIKAYADEAIGSPSYYVFCRAQNSCGITTSSAIAVNVTTYIEEDCATRGNEGEAQFGFDDGGCGQASYSETACWTTSTRAKYLTYTAPEGKYLKTAKVTVAVSSGSKCGYAYSTDGGTTWTYAELTSLSSTLTEKTINLNSLSGTINAFRIGRNLQDGSSKDWGVTSGNFYLSKACFEYTNACTATTITPSTASVNYEMGGAWSNPTFSLSPAAVSGGTLTYSSSNEDIASVDDDGTVTFNGDAGTVTITASYAGGTVAAVDYCASEGSYTINVSCPGGAPKVVPDGTVNMSGCNTSVTLHAKKQDGTAFADGTYQWFRNGTEIDGATSSSYTATQAGTYTVERTNGTGCTTPSTNSAIVTSETTEPEVERLVPFQYYHVDTIYRENSIMRFRHLFAVKNSGKLDGKSFKLYVSRNGGDPTDVTNSNALAVWTNADGRVDTVMLDLNKLSGKYSENDELVYTCKAIDCSGNVSEVYKATIQMHVIGSTPTLALICSGSDKANGTRKTGELTVGGDFLTGYNKADLCQQTGNTSFDASTEWGLYTRLKANYIVTPVNGYAIFNKLNYEPFDILLLTDYPKASKSDAAATVLDDMAGLVDFRPMLSLKAHMVSKTPSKWAAKGFTTSPVHVTGGDGRIYMNIVCYAHPMFDGIKEAGDHIFRDHDDNSQIVYEVLTEPGYENSKGLQGFEIDAAENFVTIGLIHYNATAAEDYPTTGELSWTPALKDGKSLDRMLVAAVERQTNLEARLIVLAVNCGAQTKFTETGRTIVHKCLEYLLSDATDPITPVADCSFTFDNGAGALHEAEWYQDSENCPGCTGTLGDGLWSTEANWGPDRVSIPGEFTSVRIAAPVTVDMEHAVAMEARIVEGGSITIPAGMGLDVKSTIRRMDDNEISPTEINELTLEASAESNGTLIFNNKAGDTKATVWAYSKGYIEDGVKNYQYIGTPFKYLNAVYNYYGSWIYSWDIKKNGNWGWVAVKNGGPMSAWTGYCITQESPAYYETSGTMTETGTVDIAVPAGNNMVVGNSWTAPIDINALTTDDLEGLVANIYFFNTGVDKKGTGGAAGSRYVGGTYVTVPVEAARYTGDDDHINSMQGFFVKNTGGSDGTLHLDYDRHVRGTTRGSIIGDALHAPKRAKAASDEPAVLKIKVSGENYDDKLLLLAREDFTTGFDNGWDGDKWDGNESALYIYTKDEEGTENSVSALPEMEGTVIGFRAGEDDAYTLHFEYLNSAEELYLFDTETNAYTKIMTGATYRFFTEDKEKHERFIITRKSPQIATDVDEVDSGKRREVRKLLIEDKMYILVNGMLYDATGKVVK